MITGIDAVTVYVSDQDLALEFFVKQLGFEKRADLEFAGSRRVEVSPPGDHTRIVLARDYASDWGERRTGKFTGIVLASRNIMSTYDSLHARGVRFTEPPSKQDGSIQTQFFDQDENSYVLIQRVL